MDASELYEKLKKVQEPKGFYFSNNHERVMELLDALLVNKARYGYMVCPCRLASGDRDNHWLLHHSTQISKRKPQDWPAAFNKRKTNLRNLFFSLTEKLIGEVIRQPSCRRAQHQTDQTVNNPALDIFIRHRIFL